MAQVLIRNLDDETVARLKRKAEQAGLSLEAFLRQLLTEDTPSRSQAAADIDALRKTVRPPKAGDLLAADLVREMRQTRS